MAPPVRDGRARLLGHHDSGALLQLAIGLRLRNQAVLAHFVAGVTNPESPSFHAFLTQSEANSLFNPTSDAEARVVSWLQSNGLTVTRTYPNHLLVDAQGSTEQVERMLHVTLNDYSATDNTGTRIFFSPDREPIIDAPVADTVAGIVGLDTYYRTQHLSNGIAHNQAPYYPQDIANAYDINPLWNAGYTGGGQHVAVVLDEAPPSRTAINNFAGTTGASLTTYDNGRLVVIPVDGGNTNIPDPESAIDVEMAGSMAPSATLDYYEAPSTDNGLLDALNTAGTDGNNNREISNSWGHECEPSAMDAFMMEAEAIFQSNEATGHNYLFGSGDFGSTCDQSTQSLWYPASSPWVTAVGGTQFANSINGSYPGEVAWSRSGGGFSKVFSRPSWQHGPGYFPQSTRGIPDVAADASTSSSGFICADRVGTATNVCGSYGNGTSYATPLWAAILTDINQYLAATGHPYSGFIAPTLYDLAVSYPAAFHDITSGSNGWGAATGWDPATGLGSPDAWQLAQALTHYNGFGSKPQVYSTTSTQRYRLGGSDGSTWQDMDPSNLSVTFTPSSNCTAAIFGNADLWTEAAGYNEDLRVAISGGSYPQWTGVGWKESGGPVAFSPNGVVVQGNEPLSAGVQYTVRLQWKANKSDPNVIDAAAGVGPTYSPSGLTVICSPTTSVASAVSTQSYTLWNSDGSTWTNVDPTNLTVTYTPSSNCQAVVMANADLYTGAAGYNADLGISASGGSFGSGQLVTWKEGGGSSAYSPIPAFVHTVTSLAAGTTYTFRLQWKANKSDPNAIVIGAGTSPTYSPTRLTVLCAPAATVLTAGTAQRYTLPGSDGVTWQPMDSTNLTINVTPTANCMGVMLAGADLWTTGTGYNMDLGVSLGGGTYGTSQLVSWKETGGLGGAYSPGATASALPRPLLAGTTYTLKLQWKADASESNPIYAAAGVNPFSPTQLTLLCYPVS